MTTNGKINRVTFSTHHVNSLCVLVKFFKRAYRNRHSLFTTDVYYLLSTDHGTYRIGIDGVFAHPEYAQRIKPDSIYEITAIGQSIPFMGVYPRVKELRKPVNVTAL